ncbi:hypothetical protein ACHHYP_15511 [Achlya hypogyna]|uniref:EF-hand domain-containing protein n=1 Tax=Achlya hypogyna TaxID=1202772 RepID=A0A1V9YAR1_ACHHY|nr:hypothetical protein ACHHYP_15511 [Achlya hypogyna]
MRPTRTPRRGVPNERTLRATTPRGRPSELPHAATPRPDPEIEVILPKLRPLGPGDRKKTQPCLSARLVPRLQVAMDSFEKSRSHKDHKSAIVTKERLRQCFSEAPVDEDVPSSDIDMLFLCLDTDRAGALPKSQVTITMMMVCGQVVSHLQHLKDRHTKLTAPPVHTGKKQCTGHRPVSSVYERPTFQPPVPSKQSARSLAW